MVSVGNSACQKRKFFFAKHGMKANRLALIAQSLSNACVKKCLIIFVRVGAKNVGLFN